MPATEVYFIPYKMAAIKYDPLIVKEVPYTDPTIKKLSKISYFRITGNVLICDVDCLTGGVKFYNGSFPPATRVNLVKGITEIEIQ